MVLRTNILELFSQFNTTDNDSDFVNRLPLSSLTIENKDSIESSTSSMQNIPGEFQNISMNRGTEGIKKRITQQVSFPNCVCFYINYYVRCKILFNYFFVSNLLHFSFSSRLLFFFNK